jgi:hypothetical protein
MQVEVKKKSRATTVHNIYIFACLSFENTADDVFMLCAR